RLHVRVLAGAGVQRTGDVVQRGFHLTLRRPPVGDQCTESVRCTTTPGRLQRGQVPHHVRHLGVDGSRGGAGGSTCTGHLRAVHFESGHGSLLGRGRAWCTTSWP